MKRFTDSIRASLRQENWYAALALALTMPDICGRVDSPKSPSGPRYAAWFDAWMRSQHYESSVPARFAEIVPGVRQENGGWVRTIMSGDDCYALRCGFLHQGGADVSEQRAAKIRAALDSFHFIVPPAGLTIHKNQADRVLQLQVDMFCHEIADAVDAWALKNEGTPAFQKGVSNLLSIQIPVPGQPFSF